MVSHPIWLILSRCLLSSGYLLSFHALVSVLIPSNDDMSVATVQCPVCNSNVHQSFINQHLDSNCKLKQPLSRSVTCAGQGKQSQSKIQRFFTAPSKQSYKRKSPFQDVTNERKNEDEDPSSFDSGQAPPCKKQRLLPSSNNNHNIKGFVERKWFETGVI